MAKNHRVNLRLDDDELERLKKLAGNVPMARYCHERILQEKPKSKPEPVTQYKATSPELLRELNAIGRNLNQIARLGNTARRQNSLELLHLVAALELIHKDLNELISKC